MQNEGKEPPTSSAPTSSGIFPAPNQFFLRKRFLFPQQQIICGRGAIGEVRQALDCRTGRLVAAKIVHIDELSAQAVDRVIDEVSVLKGLSHRNVVQYIGTAREGNQLFVILEYMPGGSLATLLKRYGALPEFLARRYMADVLEGLRYLHQKNVAHRDLKCENLLLCSSGAVKLADFGCSREYRLGEQAVTLLGTPLFMAPEVATAAGPYDPFLADVWTVGTTLLQMLTGKPPFADQCSSPMKYYLLISMKDVLPPLPPNLSPACTNFLRRCLARNPEERATVEELLYHEFIDGTSDSADESSCVREGIPSVAAEHAPCRSQ